MDMLPSHRMMKQGKTVYDDDDKYSKYDKPWSVRKAWRQKPIFRYTIILAISIGLILLYVYESNHTEMIERWQKNGGVYNAGNDPQAVRDDKNNEVIPLPTTESHEDKDGPLNPEDPNNKASDDEQEYAKVKALMDSESEKLGMSGGGKGKYLFKQNPPPANLYNSDPKWAERQEKVRQAFKHAWKGYSNDCFGMDEYQPLSHTGHDWSPGGIGLMILDSLDTIMLMNLEDEYAQAREWIEKKLSFDKHQDVNLFETTIRVLGGLLSAYHLSGNDKLYLDKAIDLGDRLLGAFDSESGIPYAGVILSTGLAHKVSYISSSTAEVTTVQMELKYLSHLTGDKKYWDKAERVMKHIQHLIETDQSLDGLLPILIDPNSGNFAGAEIRLGSRGDSYYEYLLKQYLQTGKSEPIYRQMYDQATEAIKKYLVGHSYPSSYLFLGELPEGKNNPANLSPKMDHLVCFIGGSFALGATEGLPLNKITRMLSDRDKQDVELGKEITRSCYEMYNSTATRLASEIVYFNTKSSNVQGSNQDSHEKDIIIQPRDTHNILRPETVESLFLLWRITGDDKYREWGWNIFEAFEEHTKLPNGGYAALRDVTIIPPPQDNRMDTFFLAETLKYLYLLFGPDDILPLDKYILNTEAHPLPVFTPRCSSKTTNGNKLTRPLYSFVTHAHAAMKFAKYLETQSIPEWRKAYIDYKSLKKKLKVIEKYKKGRRQSRFSIPPNLSDGETATNDIVNQLGPTTSNRRTNQTLIHRSRTEPFLPSEFNNRSFTSGLWNRLSWKSGKDITLNQFESRPASVKSRQGSILDDVLEHATPPEREFFDALDAELEKITNFYYEKKHEADSKLAALKKQVMLIEEYGKHLVQIGPADPYEHPKLNQLMTWMRWRVPDLSEEPNAIETGDPNLPRMSPVKDEEHHNHHISYKVARSRLKKALFEFYRSLEFLRSYKTLNATGFAKILKKFDKTAGWKATDLYTRKLQEYDWYRSEDLEALINETEKLYVNEFAGGHRRRGMRKLRIPEVTRDYHSPVLRTGLYLGLIIPAFVRACEIALDKSTLIRLPNLYTNLQIYACFVLPLIFCLGFAVNMMVWSKSRINYKFIFEFDPRDNLNYHQFAELPALLLLIMTYVMYIDFSEAFAPAIPSEICPLIFVVILIAIMFCPFNILYLSARKWLGIALGRILLSFCFRVEFRDFFIADELNSLSYSFWTLSYFFCAYGWHWSNLDQHCQVTKFWITPIIACLPPWWRLLQCIRRYKDSGEYVHLVNAGKYMTSIWATSLTGVRRIHNNPQMQAAWLVASIINSTYTSVWDLKMDWGLLQLHSRYFLLRNDLVFYHWTYYVAMPVNVALRFGWVVNTVGLPLGGQVLGFIFGFLECYRRFQWNFFRLENEHLNNCGQFRAIKEIPLPFSIIEDAKSRRGSQIQLPAAEDEAYPRPEDTRSLGRTQTLKQLVSRPDSTSGTFYGRRDFEAKQDSDNEDKAKPGSDSMFRRITRVTSRTQDSDSEDDDEDDDGAQTHTE